MNFGGFGSLNYARSKRKTESFVPKLKTHVDSLANCHLIVWRTNKYIALVVELVGHM